MKQQDTQLPMRKTSEGVQIETRPIYIEEWLDSLPYIDFVRTSELLLEATSLTNKHTLKPSVRQELIELYHRPYQYYIDSQIKTGAHQTLQSIESFQKQTEMLKGIAINLGFSCKLVLDAELKKKTRWRQSKPPVLPMLMAINYLSHALIFSFLEYSPTPKNVWLELNQIYATAENIDHAHTSIVPPGGDPKKDTTTISDAYKRIVMAAMADHHHLPFGAIWEIYMQLNTWIKCIDISAFKAPNKPVGCFVIDLESDKAPVAFAKHTSNQVTNSMRLVDATRLATLIQDYLNKLNKNERLDESVILSPYYRKTILTYMTRSWGLPAKRYFNREPREGLLELITGLDAVYFHLNGQEEFSQPVRENDDEIISGDENYDTPMETSMDRIKTYAHERWSLVDEGQGGFAVMKSEKPRQGIRVGDLIAISSGLTDDDPTENWDLGIVRWLMVRKKKAYRIGVQKIPATVRPCSVRAVNGSSEDTRYRRGLLVGDGSKVPLSLITSRGLCVSNRDLELMTVQDSKRYTCDSQVESTTGFEQFTIKKK